MSGPTPTFQGREWLHVTTRYGRDVLLAVAGAILLGNAAPSISHFLGSDVAAVAWAAFLAVGATVSVAAAWWNRPGVEVLAQMIVGVGFLVWSLSALMQPAVDPVTWAIALVFASNAVGALYRVEMIANGRVNR